jgi:hypothetical protein
VPGTYQYAEAIVELLLHDRHMLAEAAQRIVAGVQARAQAQELRPADAYALTEAEVRNSWPALAGAVLVMVT